MNSNLLRTGLMAALLLISVSSVFAEDKLVELSASEILMREVSIIGSKYNVKDIAGSAAFLGVQDIRQHNVDDINRVLRRVPGVNLREEDGYGLFPNISLRGVDSARAAKVTIMEDGILMAPAPYSAPSAYYSPTTGRMAGIEILKGSSQIKYGPHTTGGAINYLSTPIPSTKKIYSKTTFGMFNEVRNHTYLGDTTQLGSGKFGFLIEMYKRSNTGFKTLDTVQVTRNDSEADTGFSKAEPMIKLFFEPKSSLYQRIEAKFGYTNLDANETYTGISTNDFRVDPYRRYLGSRFDEIETTQFRQHIRHFIEFSPKTSLVTTAYGNTFNRNWQKLNTVNGNSISNSGLTNTADLACLKGTQSGTCTLEVRNNNRTYYSHGIQSTLNHELVSAGGTKHEIEVGFRQHYDQVRRVQWDETFTQNANGGIDSVTVAPRGDESNRTDQTYATSVHFSDSMSKGKFTFKPGLRTEYISGTYWNGDRNDTGVDTGDRDYTVIVGGASVKYDVYDVDGRNLDYFAGMHRGFSPAGPRSSLRDGLREETSLGFEVGTRYANAKRAFASEVVFFHTYINDLIINDSVGGTGAGNNVNGGEVRTLGLEMQANYDRGLDKGWSIQTPGYIAATWTRATFETDTGSTDTESIFTGAKKGNYVPYIPQLTLSAGLGVIFQKWSANLDASYVTETFADGANTGRGPNVNERFGKIDSRLVMDVAMGYQWSSKVRMFSNFKNITSQEYIVSRQPHGPRPGMPFNMMAGLEFDL
jgi:Fe(3+) dicitrate transport protein